MVMRKNNLDKIWFLTSIHADESTILRHPNGGIKVEKSARTFGYYRGFQAAWEAVKNNTGNMRECFYNYLVMECIGEGVHALCNECEWFKWNGNNWSSCKKPEWARGMINWALG